jgi:lipoprotein-releasing system permease protein
MPYELFVGWRYLYSARHSSAIWVWFVFGVVALAAGIAFFLYATRPSLPHEATIFGLSLVTAKTVAAVTMLLGGLSVAAAALLALFSTFTAISILGVAIGVSILVWVLSVTSGFQEEFRRKVLGVNAHILIVRYGEFSEYRRVMRAAEQMPGVVAAAPFVFNEMMVAKGQRLSGVLVKGVDPALVGRVLDLPSQIDEPHRVKRGELPRLLVASTDEQGRNLRREAGIVIGRELAKKLDAHVGDQLRLISPLSGLDIAGWSAGAGEIPRSRDFRLTAIFFSGFNEYDKRLVYVHMREAQNFLDQGDIVTGVDLKVSDVFGARKLARRIASSLGEGRYRTIDWSELNHNLFTALAIQKLFLQIVIGFIVVVAAFNVLAALAMLVIRKTREISILKSMGMSSVGVARIFQSAGVIVWLLGTGLGLAWGYLGGQVLRRYGFPLDPKVYHISELPVRMDPWEFLLTAVFALLVCILATLYPSVRAARLNPVEGLRYD